LFYKVIILFFLPLVLFSQIRTIEDYKKRVFNLDGKSLNYRILEPFHGDKDPIPLFIFLHGSGERGNDNTLQLVHGSTFFLKETEKEKYNSYVIFPQCSKNNRWSYHKEDPWTSKKEYFEQGDKKISYYGNLVILLIEDLVKKKNIDRNRIYISGLSMGGYGTFDLVSHHPELFAAAAPICGGADMKLLINAKDVPFWIFHGDNDKLVPVEYSRDAYKELKKFSDQNKYTEYKGVNHNAWDYVFKESNYLDWFFNQRKTSIQYQ